MIRIWNAFSPNNSSSYRLVARFEDPRVAREAAVEVATFLLELIAEVRGRWLESEALAGLANRYGFDVNELLEWSTQLHVGDEPQVMCDGELVVVYHRYCQGFGDLDRALAARGGNVDPEDYHPTTISALFRSTPGADPLLDAELDALFAHIRDVPKRGVRPFETPWPTHDNAYGTGAYFRDAGSVGLWVPVAPQDLAAFQHWLASRGIEQPSLRWCVDTDAALFRAIAAARCSACGGALEYLDPRIHDIESPQLVCKPCGGLYELSTFMKEVS